MPIIKDSEWIKKNRETTPKFERVEVGGFNPSIGYFDFLSLTEKYRCDYPNNNVFFDVVKGKVYIEKVIEVN